MVIETFLNKKSNKYIRMNPTLVGKERKEEWKKQRYISMVAS